MWPRTRSSWRFRFQATGATPQISTPIALFDLSAFGGIGGAGGGVGGGNRQQYDVSGDGQRFIVSRPVDEAREAPITILTHWTATLKE